MQQSVIDQQAPNWLLTTSVKYRSLLVKQGNVLFSENHRLLSQYYRYTDTAVR